jgi:hypothetical protein
VPSPFPASYGTVPGASARSAERRFTRPVVIPDAQAPELRRRHRRDAGDRAPAKVADFAGEAEAQDSGTLKDYAEDKRVALIACLAAKARMRARDDLATMFCKRMAAKVKKAREELEEIRRPDGQVADWYILLGGRTMTMVAIAEDGRVLLVRQYRPGPGRVLLELPGPGIFGSRALQAQPAAELSWTDAEQTQAIDRSHRIGQAEPVTAWRIIAAQTIDARIAGLIDSKAGLAARALDGAGQEASSPGSSQSAGPRWRRSRRMRS